MVRKVKRFIRDESGATAIEYGLIVALMAIVSVIAVQNLGQGLIEVVTVTSDAIGSATS